jgi:AraC-like DNA-binding protein
MGGKTGLGIMERVNIRDREQWAVWAEQAKYRSARLAQLLGVSGRQLHRYTRKLFGCSPQAWLNERRLALAPGLLRHYRSVKMVSYELGFKRVSHFSREFKLRHGMAPGHFLAWSDGEAVERPLQITNGGKR